MKQKLTLSLILSGLLIGSTWANEASLKQQLEKMGATNVKLSASPLVGFKTVVADQGVLQISDSGQYVIQGRILEIKNGKMTDITNQALLTELNALSNEMIVFPAKNEKHVITVFFDISCYYCQVMHSKMKEYNDLGITVRYLAYPRTGLDSQTAKQMEAIWTEKDPVTALNEAEKGNLPKQLKTPNLVKKHFELGRKFGVTGTPSIVDQNGETIAGFVEPKELLEMLSQ